MGSPETRVKWTMNENEVSKGGIYEQPTFAIIVQHSAERPFTMALNMKATTYGGLPVIGKRGSRITFKRAKKSQQDQQTGTGQGCMAALTGGSLQVGENTWTAKEAASDSFQSLDGIDLEKLTQMKSALLGPQGPGAETGHRDRYLREGLESLSRQRYSTSQ